MTLCRVFPSLCSTVASVAWGRNREWKRSQLRAPTGPEMTSYMACIIESMDWPSSPKGAEGLTCGFWASSATESKVMPNKAFTRGSRVDGDSNGRQYQRLRRETTRGQAYEPRLVPGKRELSVAAAGLATSQEAVTYITKHSRAKGRNPR